MAQRLVADRQAENQRLSAAMQQEALAEVQDEAVKRARKEAVRQYRHAPRPPNCRSLKAACVLS